MDEEFDEVTRAIKEGVNIAKGVKHTAEKLMPSTQKQVVNTPIQQVVPTASEELPFVFTGQYTDLQYFQNNKILPYTSINYIPDEAIKEAVVNNFEMASKEGLVMLDKENHFITLTEEGKKYISTPSFKDAAKKEQMQAVAKLRNALNGTVDATKQAVTTTASNVAGATATSSSVASAATTVGNAAVGGAVVATKTAVKVIQNM